MFRFVSQTYGVVTASLGPHKYHTMYVVLPGSLETRGPEGSTNVHTFLFLCKVSARRDRRETGIHLRNVSLYNFS